MSTVEKIKEATSYLLEPIAHEWQHELDTFNGRVGFERDPEQVTKIYLEVSYQGDMVQEFIWHRHLSEDETTFLQRVESALSRMSQYQNYETTTK